MQFALSYATTFDKMMRPVQRLAAGLYRVKVHVFPLKQLQTVYFMNSPTDAYKVHMAYPSLPGAPQGKQQQQQQKQTTNKTTPKEMKLNRQD